jgi:hypothetical protein
LKEDKNMKHTTPPTGPSGLPETDADFQKYKDARHEGYCIINALLELKFDNGIHDLVQFEKAIQEHLAMEPSMIAPWRNSVPLTQAACRDGMRLAALNFYWEHRDAIQVRLLAASFGDEIALAYRATAGRPEEYMLGRCEQLKARLDSIRQRFPDLAQALSDGLALLTFEPSQVQ